LGKAVKLNPVRHGGLRKAFYINPVDLEGGSLGMRRVKLVDSPFSERDLEVRFSGYLDRVVVQSVQLFWVGCGGLGIGGVSSFGAQKKGYP